VTDSLQACFQQAAGSTAEGARLIVDEVPARIGCDACGSRVELTMPPFLCARRGSSDVEFLGGGELLVDGVELDSDRQLRPDAYNSPLMTAAPEGRLFE